MLYASTSPQRASPISGVALARRSAQLIVLAFVVNGILGAPARLIAAIAERHRIACAVAQLEALSDHVLADIGIERQDIRRAVCQGRN